MSQPYIISHETPSLATYLHLRSSTGIGAKTAEAVTIGLAHGLFSIQVMTSSGADNTSSNNVIGMGRIIGDGGCFFQVVDICVLPQYQGKGVGKMIMGEIKKWLDGNVPKSAYVSLFADGEAKRLYRHYGFEETSPGSIGMALEY